MPDRITERALRALRPGQYLRDDTLVARKTKTGKVTFALRIQGPDPLYKRLAGTIPPLTLEQVRGQMDDIVAKRQLKVEEPLPDQGFTIQIAWEINTEDHEGYRAKLLRTGKSPATIESYESALRRLDPVIRSTPLRTLSQKPKLFANEYDRIAERSNKDRREAGHGLVAARSAGRFVRAVYRHATTMDGTLPARSPTSTCELGNLEESLHRLPVLGPEDLPRWWRASAQLDAIKREAMLFALLSGLRRSSLFEMEWEHHDRVNVFAFNIPKPKGGTKKAFDLILSKPMLASLGRALAYSRGPWLREHGTFKWVWPAAGTTSGHLTSLRDKKIGWWLPPHGLRRTYSSMAKNAGIGDELIGRLLNHREHGTKAVTAGYVRTEAIGGLLMDVQEKISAAIIDALGDDSLRVVDESMEPGDLAVMIKDSRPRPR